MNLRKKWKAIESRPDIIGLTALLSLFLIFLAYKIGVFAGYVAFLLLGK